MIKKSAREHILSKLRKNTGFSNEDFSNSPDIKHRGLAWTDPGAECEALKTTLNNLAVVFQTPEDKKETEQFLNMILDTHSIRSCVAWDHPLIESSGIPEILGSKGILFRNRFQDKADFKSYCSQADLGITAADAIVEESGTVVTRAKRGWERATSLLPPVHLALISVEKRLFGISDLPWLFAHWTNNEGGLPSAVHLISGPSKTADIEFNLVLGVHGPKAVYVLGMRF
ncbi:MAG: LUD domain-containing protein [Deltaproteobacteria bacterium]|nr:LUD domain-containing protein [Deltaproteobacteria bacterium]MBW2084054.1 LUD domain-containing protein [Deltaproteobacteria bacterium]